MYSIAYENQDIVIRINKDSIDKRILSGFLESIELEEIRRKSKLTKKQAMKISKEINRNVWNHLKDKVLEG
jgi:hypothetical protein